MTEFIRPDGLCSRFASLYCNLLPGALPRNDSGQVFHTHLFFLTKQHNLVLVKGR